MRLGEALVQKGTISEKQLAKALDAQLIFGAHLGTCLIELGYIDEHSLGHLLAEILQVRYASRDLLDEIPPHVINTLTPGVADKHKAIPFELKEKVLHVAMVNPRHLPSLDEISFVSGCRIEAWVAPEVRVMQALERYYEVPRRMRYIALANRLDAKPAREAGAPSQERQRQAVMTAAAGPAGGVETPAAPQLVPPEPRANDRDEFWAGEGGQSQPVRPSRRHRPEDGLAAVSEELCRADDADRIVKVALNHAARGMARCILFAVKGSAAVPQETRGFRLDPKSARDLSLPINSDSIFGLLLGEPCYRGPVLGVAKHRAFFEALHLSIPAEILIAPVYLGDRIAALFYGDAGETGRIQGDTEEYLRLMRILALSMGLIALKKKIRSA